MGLNPNLFKVFHFDFFSPLILSYTIFQIYKFLEAAILDIPHLFLHYSRAVCWDLTLSTVKTQNSTFYTQPRHEKSLQVDFKAARDIMSAYNLRSRVVSFFQKQFTGHGKPQSLCCPRPHGHSFHCTRSKFLLRVKVPASKSLLLPNHQPI